MGWCTALLEGFWATRPLPALAARQHKSTGSRLHTQRRPRLHGRFHSPLPHISPVTSACPERLYTPVTNLHKTWCENTFGKWRKALTSMVSNLPRYWINARRSNKREDIRKPISERRWKQGCKQQCFKNEFQCNAGGPTVYCTAAALN